MHVLRLNLHYELLSKAKIGDALRELADFIEDTSIVYPKELHPLCNNNCYDAFRYNRQFDCRLTGTIGIATLDKTGWHISQEGIEKPAAKFEENIIVK